MDERYPGPVRSKQYPYGLPENNTKAQAECDTGTLHASRSAYLAGRILLAKKDSKIKPAVTLENPPPSDVREHLSAWELEEVKTVTKDHRFAEAAFNTCCYQSDIPVGRRFFKPQLFKGTLLGLATMSGECTCGNAGHVAVVGKELSSKSGEYPSELCQRYAKLLLDHFSKIGAMEFYQLREAELKGKMDGLKKGPRPGGKITQEDVNKSASVKSKPQPGITTQISSPSSSTTSSSEESGQAAEPASSKSAPARRDEKKEESTG